MRGAILLSGILAASVYLEVGLCAQDRTDPPEVVGSVVDEAGKPVPGIMVGVQWSVQGERVFPTWRADTNSEGRFYLDLGRTFPEGATILALDRAGGRAGKARYDPARPGTPLSIRLEPAGLLKGSLCCPELEENPRRSRLVVYQESDPHVLMGMVSVDGSFAFLLPLGSYLLGFRAEEFEREVWEFRLTASRREVEMAGLAVKPNVLARHFDKAPPEWKATHAQGAAPGVQPSDFRGRLALVLFWRREHGEEGIEALTCLHQIHERFKDVAERFAVIGFHVGQAASLEDLLAKLGEADFRFT